MMKKVVISFILLTAAVTVYSGILTDAGDLALPYRAGAAFSGRLTAPVLITDGMNWRGIVQPGRNVIRKGDTISVIYSRTTSDPVFFQKMYQSYSFDGGQNWTEAELGHSNCVRTYPHQEQIFDAAKSNPGANPHLIWLEKLADPADDTLFFSYDEMVPFQLFTLYSVNTGLSVYFPYMCAWGTGDTLFATGLNWTTKDLYGWTSPDNGATWTPVTFRPISSDAGSVQAVVDNGKEGYGFAYYGVQHVAGRPIYPMFMETTDYGQTWTAEQEFLNIAITDTLGASDTLSVTWQGFSLIVDHLTNTPYIAGKFDYHKDPNYSYNYGEIWFTKPTGGTPGAYTFDADNPVPVFAGDPSVFEHLAGYATISYYYSNTGIVLLIFFDAISQDSMSWQLYCASSLDEGNSWDVQQVTPNDTFYQNDMADASFYVTPAGDLSVVFCNVAGSHGDLDLLNYWHIGVNVVTDLGLPAPGVFVEEIPTILIPSSYRVSASTTRGNCSFAVGLPEGGMTSLKVFDASGRMVTEIVKGYLSAGQYRFEWNTGCVPSGNYVYRLTSNGFVTTGKVIVAE